jgi:hypothetical protein
MKVLASRIAKELRKAEHYAVYEPELTRVWPDDGRTREAKLLYSPNSMVGGSASTRTDSARFLIKRGLAEISQRWIELSGLDRHPR